MVDVVVDVIVAAAVVAAAVAAAVVVDFPYALRTFPYFTYTLRTFPYFTYLSVNTYEKVRKATYVRKVRKVFLLWD